MRLEPFFFFFLNLHPSLAHAEVTRAVGNPPFLMTSDVDVELEGLEVSLVSWLRWVSGLQTQLVAGAPWDGRKLVGWEQFFRRRHSRRRASE